MRLDPTPSVLRALTAVQEETIRIHDAAMNVSREDWPRWVAEHGVQPYPFSQDELREVSDAVMSAYNDALTRSGILPLSGMIIDGPTPSRDTPSPGGN